MSILGSLFQGLASSIAKGLEDVGNRCDIPLLKATCATAAGLIEPSQNTTHSGLDIRDPTSVAIGANTQNPTEQSRLAALFNRSEVSIPLERGMTGQQPTEQACQRLNLGTLAERFDVSEGNLGCLSSPRFILAATSQSNELLQIG